MENPELMDLTDKDNVNQKKCAIGEFCYAGPSITMSMSIWNCRVIGLPWNIQLLIDVARQKNPIFVFMCKTKWRHDELKWVRKKIGYEWMVVVIEWLTEVLGSNDKDKWCVIAMMC